MSQISTFNSLEREILKRVFNNEHLNTRVIFDVTVQSPPAKTIKFYAGITGSLGTS